MTTWKTWWTRAILFTVLAAGVRYLVPASPLVSAQSARTRISSGSALPTNDCLAGNLFVKTGTSAGLYVAAANGSPCSWTGPMGSSAATVTNTGTLTAHNVILGNGSVDITALGALGSSGDVLTSQGASADPHWVAPSGGSGGLLAYTSYAPASNTVVSTTSTTLADLDATNLQITFTVPSTGHVLVKLTAYTDLSVSTQQYFWGLRDGSGLVSGSAGGAFRSVDGMVAASSFVITGLTPSASLTWKWAHGVTGGATGRTIYGPGTQATVSTSGNFMPAIMEVWTAP